MGKKTIYKNLFDIIELRKMAGIMPPVGPKPPMPQIGSPPIPALGVPVKVNPYKDLVRMLLSRYSRGTPAAPSSLIKRITRPLDKDIFSLV